MTEQEWRDTYAKLGGIAECMALSWLTNGCPKCGCAEWLVTNDGWAYCDGCYIGIPTAYSFTHQALAHWGKDGLTCFMCKDTGIQRDGSPCDECDKGRRGP